MNIYMAPNSLPTKYLLIIRGRKSNWAVEKRGRHHLKKGIKVNISDGMK